MHSTKSLPSLPPQQIEQVQPEAIEGLAADPKLAQQPDEEEQILLMQERAE